MVTPGSSSAGADRAAARTRSRSMSQIQGDWASQPTGSPLTSVSSAGNLAQAGLASESKSLGACNNRRTPLGPELLPMPAVPGLKGSHHKQTARHGVENTPPETGTPDTELAPVSFGASRQEGTPRSEPRTPTSASASPTYTPDSFRSLRTTSDSRQLPPSGAHHTRSASHLESILERGGGGGEGGGKVRRQLEWAGEGSGGGGGQAEGRRVGDSDVRIKVVIRVRPLNGRELGEGAERAVVRETDTSLRLSGTPYTFDSVAGDECTQEELFMAVGEPIVENALAGFNSSVFAYGQTGSGKTHTMMGDMDADAVERGTLSAGRGLTPRVFEHLFAQMQKEESKLPCKVEFSCRCSFLEIYNEQITDLLEPSARNLQLREDQKTGVYVENLSEEAVCSAQEVLRLLLKGMASRRVAATAMNSGSSRSHSVFTCALESLRKSPDGTVTRRFSRINLVDLAGSERQKLTGASGERLKEAASINRSLSQLGNVIKVLAEVATSGKARHVPYRDSRLTFLLQDSLGGNAKTVVICNVSPSSLCVGETISTLKFAQRAKAVKNNVVENHEETGDLQSLREEIRRLKEELARARGQRPSGLWGSTPEHEPTGDAGGDLPSMAHMYGGHPGKWLIKLRPQGGGLQIDPETDVSEVKDLGAVDVRRALERWRGLMTGALEREGRVWETAQQRESQVQMLSRLVAELQHERHLSDVLCQCEAERSARLEEVLGGALQPEAFLRQENAGLVQEITVLKKLLEKRPPASTAPAVAPPVAESAPVASAESGEDTTPATEDTSSPPPPASTTTTAPSTSAATATTCAATAATAAAATSASATATAATSASAAAAATTCAAGPPPPPSPTRTAALEAEVALLREELLARLEGWPTFCCACGQEPLSLSLSMKGWA